MRYLLASIVLFVSIVLFATMSSATGNPKPPTAVNAGANAVAGAAAGAHAVAGGANVKNSIDFGINTSNSNEINNMVGVGVEVNTKNSNANTNHSVNANTATGNNNYSSTGNVSSNQGQNQSANNEGVTTTVQGDEAPNLSRSPGTPATVFVDACSSGASASMPGMGATFGQGNPVCLWLSLSSAAHQQGDIVLAGKFLEEAERSLRMQTAVTRWINWVPLVGRLF